VSHYIEEAREDGNIEMHSSRATNQIAYLLAVCAEISRTRLGRSVSLPRVRETHVQRL
jgi:hypothetical protein